MSDKAERAALAEAILAVNRAMDEVTFAQRRAQLALDDLMRLIVSIKTKGEK